MGAGDSLTYFAVKDADQLTMLDAQGLPVTSSANLDLARAASPSELEPRLTARGLLTYRAARGSFQECLTGRRLPVAADGDHEALQSAYRKETTKAGAAVFAVVEGRFVQRAERQGSAAPMLVVEKVVELKPGDTCPPRLETAPLERTYWKLTQVDGNAVSPNETQRRREAHLVFGSDQGRLVGADGCNRIVGEYVVDGARIKFGKLAGTSMTCDTAGHLDQAFRGVLAEAAAWRTLGATLELLDRAGKRLARFDAAMPPSAPARPAAPRP
jgi:copper homeostasis protein (lipoprotein)